MKWLLLLLLVELKDTDVVSKSPADFDGKRFRVNSADHFAM